MTLAQVREFVEAAKNDSWQYEATYKLESIDTAITLRREGFVIMATLRGEKHYSHSLSMWGNDGLAIKIPTHYSFEAIQHAMLVCEKCDTIGQTVRVAFANRMCPQCRDKYRPTYEAKGWND